MKTKKLSLEKVKITKLENTQTIIGGHIIISEVKTCLPVLTKTFPIGTGTYR